MNKITVEKCPCGHAGCSDYHLVGIGKFVQGSGFSKEEAELIAGLLNGPIVYPHQQKGSLLPGGRCSDADCEGYGSPCCPDRLDLSVPMPQTVEHAKAMQAVGYKWLQDNAPEHLTGHWTDAHIREENGLFVAYDEAGLEHCRKPTRNEARDSLVVYAATYLGEKP